MAAARTRGVALTAVTALGFAVIAAAVLRLWQLMGQIPVGDEWYGLRAATSLGFAEILTQPRLSDYSIPIAVYLKTAAMTVGITDLTLRAPFALIGIASVVLCPLLVLKSTPPGTRQVFAGLLAVNPFLVAYGRFARPYAITVPATFVAVALFERWWHERRLRYALGYVAAAIVAASLHPVTASFILAPLLAALLRLPSVPSGQRARRVAELVMMGVGIAVAVGCVLAPGVLADPDQSLGRLHETWPTVSAWATACSLLTVVRPSWLVAVTAALAVVGGVVLAARRDVVAGALAAASTVHVAALLVLRPGHIAFPMQASRYLSPLLPLLLLAASAGAAWTAGRLARRASWAAPPALAAFVLTVLLAGPLPASWFWPNDWTANWQFRLIHPAAERNIFATADPPDFYRSLAGTPAGSLHLLELPFVYGISGNRYPQYQRLHRQHTRVGFTQGLCGGWERFEMPLIQDRVRLHSIVPVTDPQAIRAAGIDRIIVHRDVIREFALNAKQRRGLAKIDTSVEGCLSAFRAWFGDPDWEDEEVVVFAVDDSSPP